MFFIALVKSENRRGIFVVTRNLFICHLIHTTGEDENESQIEKKEVLYQKEWEGKKPKSEREGESGGESRRRPRFAGWYMVHSANVSRRGPEETQCV